MKKAGYESEELRLGAETRVAVGVGGVGGMLLWLGVCVWVWLGLWCFFHVLSWWRLGFVP